MTSLCPNCGKEVEKGLCRGCFLKLHPVKVKEFSLKVCDCGRYIDHGKWKSGLEKSLQRIVKRKLVIPREVTLKRIQILSKKTRKKEISLQIEIKGRYQNKELVQKINSGVGVKKELCDVCGKRDQYYEAIIQFRGFEPEIKINHNWISEIRKTRDGLDFYITEKGYARKIAKEFRKKNFKVKESEKLFGRNKSGKRKSRLTISIRKVEVSKDDLFSL